MSEKKTYDKKCYCGREFKAEKPWGKYCSPQCGRRVWMKAYFDRRAKKILAERLAGAVKEVKPVQELPSPCPDYKDQPHEPGF